jgi:hypothetical protein
MHGSTGSFAPESLAPNPTCAWCNLHLLLCPNIAPSSCPQTGSGKNFTIYGNEKDPGLTPRGVKEVFNIINRDSGKYTFSISLYMLELYQDTLADLLVPKNKIDDPTKLDIKKHPKGMVTVSGTTIVEVTTAKQLLTAIETGQQRRWVFQHGPAAAETLVHLPALWPVLPCQSGCMYMQLHAFLPVG